MEERLEVGEEMGRGQPCFGGGEDGPAAAGRERAQDLHTTYGQQVVLPCHTRLNEQHELLLYQIRMTLPA